MLLGIAGQTPPCARRPPRNLPQTHGLRNRAQTTLPGRNVPGFSFWLDARDPFKVETAAGRDALTREIACAGSDIQPPGSPEAKDIPDLVRSQEENTKAAGCLAWKDFRCIAVVGKQGNPDAFEPGLTGFFQDAVEPIEIADPAGPAFPGLDRVDPQAHLLNLEPTGFEKPVKKGEGLIGGLDAWLEDRASQAGDRDLKRNPDLSLPEPRQRLPQPGIFQESPRGMCPKMSSQDQPGILKAAIDELQEPARLLPLADVGHAGPVDDQGFPGSGGRRRMRLRGAVLR